MRHLVLLLLVLFSTSPAEAATPSWAGAGHLAPPTLSVVPTRTRPLAARPRLKVGRLVLVGMAGGFAAIGAAAVADEAGGTGLVAGFATLAGVPWVMWLVDDRVRIGPATAGALLGGVAGILAFAISLDHIMRGHDERWAYLFLASPLLPGLGVVAGALVGGPRPEGRAVVPWAKPAANGGAEVGLTWTRRLRR